MNREDQDKKISRAAANAKVYKLIDTEQALLRTKGNLELEETPKTRVIHWPQLLRVAASIVLMIGFGWAIYQTQFAPRWTTYVAGNDVKEYKLSDGSVITLNKNSTLRVNQNMRSKREIELEGEAFFNVRRDEDRPFVINTPDLEVAVLGTSFNILSEEALSIVSVASGRVSVSTQESSHSEILTKDEAITYDSKSNMLIKQSSDPNFLAWKTGKYTFKGVPVVDALKLLARGKNVQIRFEGDFGDSCKITTEFNNETWEEITNEFSLIHALEFVTEADGYVTVKGGNCE